jgi:transcription initiation factor TFIIIB Brf1 subunit/transcription initiation factor TFIIB
MDEVMDKKLFTGKGPLSMAGAIVYIVSEKI